MEQKKRILIVDPIHNYALEELKKRFDVIYNLHPPTEELKKLIEDVDIIVLRSGIKLSKEIIESGRNLKVIARAGVGIDNIDINTAKQKSITVFNIPSISFSSVAEFTFGSILAITRKISLANNQLRKNLWKKKELCGNELKDKTLGIIGLGKIGSYVAKIAKGFDMKVIACVKNYSEERKNNFKKQEIDLVSFDELLKKADIINLSVPLTEETKNLITSKELEIMKDTSYLINMSRGGVVNENDLYNELKNNQIAGAAIDVFEREREKSPLFDLDNIVATPHIGAMTYESQKRIAEILVQNLNNWLEGKEMQNLIC